MEISPLRKGTSIISDRKKVEQKKDFSKSFSFARDKKNQEDLKRSIDEIKKRGNRLVITKCYGDVKIYKNLIKEYLEDILAFMYNVKKDISFWQTQYFITVDTIDSKLEELTEALLAEEKENLNIAATIDEIQGLIVDIYK